MRLKLFFAVGLLLLIAGCRETPEARADTCEPSRAVLIADEAMCNDWSTADQRTDGEGATPLLAGLNPDALPLALRVGTHWVARFAARAPPSARQPEPPPPKATLL